MILSLTCALRRRLTFSLLPLSVVLVLAPQPVGAQSSSVPPAPFNVQEWFIQMLRNSLLSMHGWALDGLLSLVTRIDLFYRTDLRQTVAHPTVVELHTTSLGIAGSILGALLLSGAFSIMLRHTGLGGLTPQRLITRLIVATAAAVTSRQWISLTLELNNAVCERLGQGRLDGQLAGRQALVPLLGLTPQQTATFEQALSTTGSAIGRALLSTLFPSEPTSLLAHGLLLGAVILIVLLAIQLLLRLVFLNLLIVLAPLMLTLGVLPATASWAGLWLRWFFPAVFLQAFQVAILALSHDWLRRSYGSAGLTDPGIIPLLMSMSTLYLTLKAPRLLDIGYRSALEATSSVRAVVGGGLASAAAGRRVVDRLSPR